MTATTQSRTIILASSSRYRKSLLERLGLRFRCESPAIEESALSGEPPAATALRLAAEKAATVSHRFPEAVVIGSDQVAVCDGHVLGKPGTEAAAQAQLAEFSGKAVEFLTAVVLHCPATGLDFRRMVPTVAVFRELGSEEIARYVALDRPLDCAGAIKTEAAGIGLLAALQSEDPTAVIGLPLIALSEGLRAAGIAIP